MFECSSDSKRLLDRKEYFKKIDGEKVKADLPPIWEKSFTMGVLLPSANRYCNDCDKDARCDKCK